MGIRQFGDAWPRRFQGALGGIEIAWFACQMTQPDERPSSNTVTGWQGIITEGFRPVDQMFMVIRRKIKTAVLRISEMPQDHLGNLGGKTQYTFLPGGLQQPQNAHQ